MTRDDHVFYMNFFYSRSHGFLPKWGMGKKFPLVRGKRKLEILHKFIEEKGNLEDLNKVIGKKRNLEDRDTNLVRKRETWKKLPTFIGKKRNMEDRITSLH